MSTPTPIPLEQVDLSDLDAFAQNKGWAQFDTLRREDPVHWNPEEKPNAGFWAITRYADIWAVDRDSETFTSSKFVNLEEIDDDLEEEIDDDIVVPEIVGDVDGDVAVDVDVEEPDAEPVPARPRAKAGAAAGDDEEEDDEEADPDDVEEDLDTILRDRIKAGTDDDEEEDEDLPVDVRTEGGDRVAPRAAEEHACPECFLLVRRSQFSTRRTDCPGGLDGDDCPMMAKFA